MGKEEKEAASIINPSLTLHDDSTTENKERERNNDEMIFDMI